MAIKTFVGEDIEQLDKEVNSFIEASGTRSLPVRTEAYAIPYSDGGAKIMHKAVVFYDKNNIIKEETVAHCVILQFAR